MKLAVSTQSLVDQRVYLSDFKMNLAKTLHSDHLKKFTSITTIDSIEPSKSCVQLVGKHRRHRNFTNHKKPMAPRMPVKVDNNLTVTN